MTEPDRKADDARPGGVMPEHVRIVRLGHGANCSSIGSVVDTLFVTSVVGAALLAAVAAALRASPEKKK